MCRLRTLVLGALTLWLTSTAAWAQLSTAQLSGRVADESGAVLPGVTVTATQTATGLTRSVTTDANGTYVLPNLPTGPYRLEAALQGFRTYCADRDRPAGSGDPGHQCGARDRQPRGDRLG